MGEQVEEEADESQDISILAELRSATVAELFPALANCSTMVIDSRFIGRRAQASLGRRGCTTWGDLQALSVGDLWELPHVGRLTVERILAGAGDQAALFAGDALDPGRAAGSLPSVGIVPQSAERVSVDRFIEMFVEWAQDSQDAITVADLLGALEAPLPADVAVALEDVRQLRLEDLLPSPRDASDSSELIADFLDHLGSDSRFVVARHIADPSGGLPTLESLAEPEGLTRERIRQIVNRGLGAASNARKRDQYRLLSWRASELKASLGVICRSDDPGAVEAIGRATRGLVDPDLCTATEFMMWFAGGYRCDGNWWVCDDVRRVDTVRRSLKAALEDEWLLSRSALLDRFAAVGIVCEPSDADIEFLSGWRRIGEEWWVRWDGALGDKAERVLRLTLRAMQASAINEFIGEGHALSSVQNVLSADDRFMRVSMDLDYALSEWEWEEYSTAAQEIVERIERAGGAAVLDDVVIELFNQFGLKEATVRGYAASPAFVVTNGVIRLRRNDEQILVNDQVSSAAGLYLRPDGCVVFHLPVDADVLRGSGRSIPNPFSVAVGVRPGDVRDFRAGERGSVRMSWPMTTTTGAAIGSIRSVVEDLDANLGDVVRLVFDLDAETVEGAVVTGSSLGDLTGLALTPGGETAELAAAIRVDPFEVRTALAERGDQLVASLIPDATQSSGLDEALARLDGLLG